MSNTKKITVSGGFHNADDITIRAKADPQQGIKLSVGQAKRILAHMCSYKGCICSLRHGWLIDGVSRDDFAEALEDASYRSHFDRA